MCHLPLEEILASSRAQGLYINMQILGLLIRLYYRPIIETGTPP